MDLHLIYEPYAFTLGFQTHLHCTSFLLEGKGTNSQVSLSYKGLKYSCMDVFHMGSSDDSWYAWGSYPTIINHLFEIFNSQVEKEFWNWDLVFLESSRSPVKLPAARMVLSNHFVLMSESWYCHIPQFK